MKILKIIIQIIPYLLIFIIAYFSTNTVYHFGDSDQIEQLPHIFSKIDTNYLKNDFFVNYTKEIGPRYYYSIFLSKIIKYISIETTFYLITLLINYLICIIMFLTVKLLNKNKYIPYVCIIILISIKNLGTLGGAGMIYGDTLIPQLISLVLMLYAYLLSLKGKYLAILIISLISLIFQPSLTLLTLCPIMYNLFLNKKIPKKNIKIFFLLISNLLLTYLLFLRSMDGYQINVQQYIYILAYFRHPHHYIPSQFLLSDYRNFIFIIIIFITSLIYLYIKNKDIYKYLIHTTIIILLILLVGYIFVEIIPIKQIVEIQTFRLVYLLRWMSIIIIPITLSEIINKKFGIKTTNQLCLIFIFLLSIYSFYKKPLLFKPNIHITYDKNRTILYDFIKINTQNDTLFLTPPDFGDIRVIPKRAIVVDYKSFPFNKKAMVEWFQRIKDCYGDGDINLNYKKIEDDKISYLISKYNFNYIILHSSTKTKNKEIFNDGIYKIIKLDSYFH